jgi:hypothetical protein
MPSLYEYNKKEEIYIYDAIMNAIYEKSPGPVYIWDPNEEIYKYGNTLPAKKNYKYNKTFNPKLFMSRGDVICFGGAYRNERKMIFNGKKLEDLYTEIDDYGSVPPNYEVCDDGFSIGDFENLIDHNSINWLSLKKLKEIKIFEKNDIVIGSVEIKGKLWTIDCYIHQKFDERHFIKSFKNLKITFQNNQILFLDNSNVNDLYKINYSGKLINDKTTIEINNFINNFTLSIIGGVKNSWYIYNVNKTYKYEKEDPIFPCILINNKYTYELLFLNKEDFDTRMKFENSQNHLSSLTIKEITGYLITVDIIKKNNETLMKEIKNLINYKIDTYNNVKERIPFSRSDNKTLEIFL